MSGEPLNLTPSPRVLRMLGRIDFKPWQCLAELIDNSVDAFIRARELGQSAGAMFPQVNIELSAAQDIRQGRGELRVVDNGPGMSIDELENAVRAGYSGNDSVDKLGLFGMGFNVASARLGARTEVWTTRAEDDLWHGVQIDFDEMEKSGSFRAPSLRRHKIASEAEAHGTEVVISKLERDRGAYLRSGGGLRSTRVKLSRVYNKIMRDIGLQVILVGTPLEARHFCVWDKSRSVETKGEFGRVPSVLEIDEDLGSRLYCDDCWVWLTTKEAACPACGLTTSLRRRDRRVRGWLGIQRFFDPNDYGVDLIRNGRVIEERSKSFFSWTNPETDESLPEYPVEQTHWGGRIVGELSIDFVPLGSHQKDSFDQSSLEWRQTVEAVRGKGPIIQKFRQQAGFFDRNLSPLARLHAGFRRGQPAGLRWLVPGDGTGRGFNKPARDWASKFWDGESDFQSDLKWYEAVLLVEEANRKAKGADVPPELKGDDEFAEREPAAEDEDGAHGQDEAAEPDREEDGSLSIVVEVPQVPGAPRLEVTAERLLKGALAGGRPFEFNTVASRVSFVYDPKHAAFSQTLTEPVDFLVEELAYQVLLRSTTSQPEWPVSIVGGAIRDKYFPWTVRRYEAVRDEAEDFLKESLEYFTEALSPLAPLAMDVVDDNERAQIAIVVSHVDHGGAERVREVIESGRFPQYLGPRCLPKLIRQWPELFFDGNFVTVSYLDVVEALRPDVLERLIIPVLDLLWIANPDGPQAGGVEWRALLARASGSLRLLQGWRAA
jgi:histidine kinase/DNA gyrase B/HSP90-like ATPase